MAAPLTIEQIVLNHNINVNMTDADMFDGKTVDEFSLVGHKHSADDITTGTMSASRLPSATTVDKGIVKLSSSTDSTDQTMAATPYAVNQVKVLANGKANTTHKHNPSDINAGTFTARMVAFSENVSGTPIIRNIIISNTAPTNTVGNNGDLYFVYE